MVVTRVKIRANKLLIRKKIKKLSSLLLKNAAAFVMHYMLNAEPYWHVRTILD